MKNSIKKGLGFGLTSGIITTIGLIIGLYFSTKSVLAVMGGIIIIAIVDSLSDSLGIHISEETNSKNSKREIWESTCSTFCFKFIFAISFIIPFLFFEALTAILISIVWGLLLISLFSYYLALSRKQPLFKTIAEHFIITVVVIIITYFVGSLVNKTFS